MKERKRVPFYETPCISHHIVNAFLHYVVKYKQNIHL